MLELKGIKKTFGGVKALQGVDFAVAAGEIVGLVGGNGAGKSTLMKISAGAYLPDEGTVTMNGQTPHSPAEAIHLGVSLVRQELIQAGDLDVGANVMLGHEPHRYGIIDRGALYRLASKALERVGGGIDVHTLLGSLSPGQKQRVEIARALSLNAKVLLLDEPTATLTETDAAMLFDLLRDLRKQGLAMVYISHRLAEVLEITDRIVCLRDGQKVAEVSTKETTRTNLVEFLAGAGGIYATDVEAPPSVTPEVLLEVRGRVTFDLHAGEILGLAGLVGAGRTSVLTGLFGGRPGRQPDNLQVKVRGQSVAVDSPAAAIRAGLALVPEERGSQGLILDMLIERNIALPEAQQVLARGRERDRGAVHEAVRHPWRRRGVDAVGRQPAEDRAVEVDGDVAHGAAARRADARPGHQGQARRSRRRAQAGRRGQGHHRFKLGGRRDRGALPPCPGAQPWRDRRGASP